MKRTIYSAASAPARGQCRDDCGDEKTEKVTKLNRLRGDSLATADGETKAFTEARCQSFRLLERLSHSL